MADALARCTWDGAEIILAGNLYGSPTHPSCCQLGRREKLRQSKFLLFLASHWDPVILCASTFKLFRPKLRKLFWRSNIFIFVLEVIKSILTKGMLLLTRIGSCFSNTFLAACNWACVFSLSWTKGQKLSLSLSERLNLAYLTLH